MSIEKATPEVLQIMMSKAYEKLAVAKENQRSGFGGDASSRAYYAVFHAISAVLAERGLSFSSHVQTLGAFNRELVKTGVFPTDTFRKLQRLFEDRQLADYDWSRKLDEKTVVQDIFDAEWLVNTCRQYLEESTGQKMK